MKHTVCSKIVVVVVMMAVVVATSCRPDTICRENTKVGMVCEFRRAYFDEGRQLQVATAWDSITAIGLGQETPLYSNAKNLVQISLPMHVSGDSTTYALTYRNITDTICVRHTNSPEFISMECGCAVNHTILLFSNTRHWIDSVAITNSTISRDGKANVELWMFDWKK